MREFTDTEGLAWQVWEVNPSIHGRTTMSGKLRGYLKVPEAWLCFMSGRDRRRLTPVPRDWEGVDDAQLRELCNQAEVVPLADK